MKQCRSHESQLKTLQWLPTGHRIKSKHALGGIEALRVLVLPTPLARCMASLCSSHEGLTSAPQAGGLSCISACLLAVHSLWHSFPSRWPKQPPLLIQIEASLTLPRNGPQGSNQVRPTGYRLPGQPTVLLGTVVIMYIFVMIFLLHAPLGGQGRDELTHHSPRFKGTAAGLQ